MTKVAWLTGIWSLALAGALGNASCTSEPPVEQCFLPGDEDGNGLADCDDATCWRANGECKEKCDDQPNDEDADGTFGCDDPDCWVKDGTCAEACTDGKDEDGDGAVDCADSDCWVKDGGCPESCVGGNDEDGDGAVDCADSDCWTQGAGCAEQCSGGNDEDADAATDCFDSDCMGKPECTESCTGGKDEDVDNLVDCDDPDCLLDPACVPSFDADVKPIFQKHCAGQACHIEGIGAGLFVVTKYDDMLKPSMACAGKQKGECALIRIKEGSMPKDCVGCVKPDDIAVIQAWVDGGLAP
ncbi:MAG: hypothetical protein FJ096_05685 [Deltaproteobacteria bacterium]|nr:hypothetical protein [Deltaproteobacteria bacterium]